MVSGYPTLCSPPCEHRTRKATAESSGASFSVCPVRLCSASAKIGVLLTKHLEYQMILPSACPEPVVPPRLLDGALAVA